MVFPHDEVDHLFGPVELFGNEKCLKNQAFRRMVAKGGIEPPTRGFSTLFSKLKELGIQAFTRPENDGVDGIARLSMLAQNFLTVSNLSLISGGVSS